MSRTEFNNKLGKRLATYSSKIDDEALWSQIEHRVPRQRRKRRSILLWIFGTVMLVGVGFLLFPNEESTDGPTASSTPNQHADYYTNAHNDERSPSPVQSSTPDAMALSVAADTSGHHSTRYVTSSRDTTPERDKLIKVEEPLSPSALTQSKRRNSGNILDIPTQGESPSPIALRVDAYPTDTRTGTLSPQVNVATSADHPTDARHQHPESIRTLQLTSVESMKSKRIVPSAKLLVLTDQNKRQKHPKSNPEINPHITLAYNLGYLTSNNSENTQAAYDGEAGYSHSISATYTYPFSHHIEALATLQYQSQSKVFDRTITRDTIVPSSHGEQIIAYNQYANGTIDTESGIPEVRATVERQLVSANTYRYIDIGIGVAYRYDFDKIGWRITSLLQRSHLVSYEGYGQKHNTQSFDKLEEISNYTPADVHTRLSIGTSLRYPIYSNCELSIGAVYNRALADQILNHQQSVRHHILSAEVGLVIGL